MSLRICIWTLALAMPLRSAADDRSHPLDVSGLRNLGAVEAVAPQAWIAGRQVEVQAFRSPMARDEVLRSVTRTLRSRGLAAVHAEADRWKTVSWRQAGETNTVQLRELQSGSAGWISRWSNARPAAADAWPATLMPWPDRSIEALRTRDDGVEQTTRVATVDLTTRQAVGVLVGHLRRLGWRAQRSEWSVPRGTGGWSGAFVSGASELLASVSPHPAGAQVTLQIRTSIR